MKELIVSLPSLRENISLAPYTTFRIGGPARWFFEANTAEDLVRAVRAARESGTRFFVLAGGSNVLVSSKGFDGLVILIRTTNYKLQTTTLYAEAGVEMPELVRETGERGLSGFEWAGGLPGSLGGAVRGNAGAFGGEIKDNILSVAYLDEQGVERAASREECGFSYRSSAFKKNNWIVLSATFQLQEGDKENIQAVAAEHNRYRRERHPLEYPNAGSVFKNCDLKLVPESVQEEFKEKIKNDPFPILPTAVLVAAANLQGTRVGDAQVSTKHTNYIVNLGNATSDEVLQLLARAQQAVKEKFGVALEPEVQYVE